MESMNAAYASYALLIIMLAIETAYAWYAIDRMDAE
jgi:hypothetical protein